MCEDFSLRGTAPEGPGVPVGGAVSTVLSSLSQSVILERSGAAARWER